MTSLKSTAAGDTVDAFGKHSPQVASLSGSAVQQVGGQGKGVAADQTTKVEERAALVDVKPHRYGWYRYTPNWLQRINNVKFLVLCLSLCSMVHMMVTNAFIPIAMTTLEKRFNYTSFQLGLFVACSDLAILVAQLPVAYFGGRGHKGKYLSVGMMLIASGSFFCILPQLVSRVYEYPTDSTSETLCQTSEPVKPDSKPPHETLLIYFYLLFGQVLHGLGMAPLCSLCVIFIDDCVPPSLSSTYVGVFYGCGVLGPVVGYLAGGFLLQVYGDVWKVDLRTIHIKPTDKRWYGAWWITFIISGSLALVCSVLMSGFPSKIPAAPTHGNKVLKDADPFVPGQRGVAAILGAIKGMRSAFKELMTCKTWTTLILVNWLESVPVIALTTFLPKVLENFFLLSSHQSALTTGGVLVPSAFLGNVFGGFLVKKKDVKGMLKFAFFCHIVGLALIFCMLIQCPKPILAGVTVQYGYVDKINYFSPNLTHSCNANCHCSETIFEPVCDANRSVLYYSACFAGCRSAVNFGNSTIYTDCSCLKEPYEFYNLTTIPNQLINLPCRIDCTLVYFFMPMFALLVFTSCMAKVPLQACQLRCVPFELRAFANGLCFVIVKFFGTIPATMFLGFLFDQTCRLFVQTSGIEKKCLFYNTWKLGFIMTLSGFAFKMFVVMALYIAWRNYNAAFIPKAEIGEFPTNTVGGTGKLT